MSNKELVMKGKYLLHMDGETDKMNKFISIVVPVFNVEKYLDECIESLVGQTYKNLEIILVDDGSTDNSGKIIDNWVTKDNRIIAIHKENGGVSSARNIGKEKAKGQYITYVDSDDKLKIDLMDKCVKTIEKDNTDIVIYGYEKITDRGNPLDTYLFGDRLYTREEVIRNLYMLICEESFGYTWNKLYKKEFLDKSKIKVDETLSNREDLIYNMELIKYINKVTFINYAGYYYRQRDGSLLNNRFCPEKRCEIIKKLSNKILAIDIESEEVKRKVFNEVLLHFLADMLIKDILWDSKVCRKEKKDIMSKIIKECPHKDKLYMDNDNAKYLNYLYKSINTGNMDYFYNYVKLGDLKRKFFG